MTQAMNSCMLSVRSVSQEDRADIKAKTAEFQSAGMEEAQAEIAAISDVLAEAKAVQEYVAQMVQEQHGEVVAKLGAGETPVTENITEPVSKPSVIAQADAIEPAEPAAAVEDKQDGEDKIGDFGRAVEVRKHTAKQGGTRYTMPKEEDARPVWARKIHVMQIEAGRFTKPENVGKWQIMQEVGRNGEVRSMTSARFTTEQEALDAIPFVVVSQRHRVYSDGTGKFGIYRNITEKKRALVKGGFDTYEAGMEYLAKNPVEIIEHKFPFPERPWLDRIERTGKDHRNGKNVTKQMFIDQFAPGGVVYGNWLLETDGKTVNADGQELSNFIYDALMDLSDAINVPPKALFLNGEMVLGIGADGKGGKNSAAAHYAPGKVLINLTKIKGAGSLAHEWWHAVDHYFARNGGRKDSDSVIAGGYAYNSTARPELMAAIKAVNDAMMTSERSTTTDADMIRQRATKRHDEALKSFDYYMNDIANPYKPKKALTKEQQAQWDALVAKLRNGELGENTYVENPSRSRGALGFSTGKNLIDLNALYKIRTGRSFLRQDPDSQGRRLHWMVQAIADNAKAMEVKDAVTTSSTGRSEYFIEAKRIDNMHTGDYWSSPEEMGARAFESFIFDKITAGQQRSDYLVHAVENRYYAASDMKPYPEGDERAKINASFEALFDAVQTEETETGVRLYDLSNVDQTGKSPEFRPVDTNSPAFLKWFGDSKVVDAEGKPLRVYHGTIALDENGKPFDSFKSFNGGGIFFTESPLFADSYAGYGDRENGRLIPVFLSIKRPFHFGGYDEAFPFEEFWKGLSKQSRDGFKDVAAGHFDVRSGTKGLVQELFDGGEWGINEDPDVIAFLKSKGYDGMTVMEDGYRNWVAFSPTQIKSAISNTGEFSDTNPDIRYDSAVSQLPKRTEAIAAGAIRRAIDRAISREQGREVRPLQKAMVSSVLRKVIDGMSDGKLSEADALGRIEDLYQKLVAKRADKKYNSNGRARGDLWIRQKLLGAVRDGAISEREMEIAEWLIKQNPALVEDMGISVKTPERGNKASGQYNPLNRVVTLFANQSNDTTAAHEILHHTERLMPQDIQDAIRAEWLKGAMKTLARKDITPEYRAYLEKAIAAQIDGDARAAAQAMEIYAQGKTGDNNSYQWLNPSEYWAVNGARLLAKRFDAQGSIWKKAHNWLMEFIEKAKSVLGLKSNAAVIRALDQLLTENAGGQIDQSRQMLGTGEAKSPQSLNVPQTTAPSGAVSTSVAGKPMGELLNMFDRNQLVELYGDRLPELKKYKKLQEQVVTDRNKWLYEADDFLNELRNMPAMIRDQFASIAHEATIEGVDPSEAYKESREIKKMHRLAEGLETRKEESGLTEKQEELLKIVRRRIGTKPVVHHELRQRFNALPQSAQETFKRLRDQYQRASKTVFDELESRINRMSIPPESKKSAILELRKEFDQVKDTIYFPLARFGDYVVIGTTESNGMPIKQVEYYESEAKQKEAAERMRKDGYKVKTTRRKAYSEDLAKEQAISEIITKVKAMTDSAASPLPKDASIDDINALSDAAGAPKHAETEQTLRELLDDINQAIIRMAPDASYRRHFMHRKNVPGYSNDFIRAYSDSMWKSGNHIANIRHGDQIAGAIGAMQERVDRADGDVGDLQDVVNHIIKREEKLREPISPIAATIGQAGFMAALASASNFLVNLTQTPILSFPWMGARYGFTDASKELTKAMGSQMAAMRKVNSLREVGKMLDMRNTITGKELEAFEKLHATGKIDITQAHDLIDSANQDTPINPNSPWNLMLQVGALPQHVSEVLNRQVTALATIRLELAKSGSADMAFEAASKVIDQTHYDYEKSNRAMLMHGNVQRVVFMFKQYAQKTAYLWARTAWLAMKGQEIEKSVARKQLAGMFAMQASAAGVLGLPIFLEAGVVAAGVAGFRVAGKKGFYTAMGLSIVAIIAAAIGDDDEDDFDTEVRNWLADHIGKDWAEIVARGAVRATGVDIAGRVNADELFIRKPDSSLEGRDYYSRWVESLGGFVFGYGANVATGVSLMADGDIQRGLEKMVPVKQVRDLMTAGRFATEGATNLSGDNLLKGSEKGDTPTNWEIITKAVGFQPGRIAEVYEGNASVKNAERILNRNRAELLDDMFDARESGDSKKIDAIWKEIREFNKEHPTHQITSATLGYSMRARKRSQRDTAFGIRLQGNKKELAAKAGYANR